MMRMEGFFFKEPVLAKRKATRNRGRKKNPDSKTKSVRRSRSTIEQQIQSNPCEVCGLSQRGCESPFMTYTGQGLKNTLIIGEAPGAAEDSKWKRLGYSEPTQFIGQSGELLRKELRLLGYDLDRDFYKINAVNCRPPGNSKPTNKQIRACWNFRVEPIIRELQPKVIFLMGGVPLQSYFHKLSGSKNVLSINRWRKFCIPDFEHGVWVVPLFHPSFILRKKNDLNLRALYKRDLQFALSCIYKQSVVPVSYEDKVNVVTDFSEVMSVLDQASTKEIIAIDYETSSKKPYDSKHRIWSISLSWDTDSAYSFPYQYPNAFSREQKEQIKSKLSKILTDSNVKKVAHNIKFEHEWSCKFFAEPKNWHWCTMLTAHILDNRGKISGLKFQVHVRYGITDYSSSVDKYMTSIDSNGLNRLYEVPLETLLLYNGMDAIFTYKLFVDQTLEMRRYEKYGSSIMQAHEFFHRGILALARAEMTGFRISRDYYDKQDKILSEQIEGLQNELIHGEYGQKFIEVKDRELNPRSTTDLKALFFDILNMEPTQYTDKGNPSLDKSSMEDWNLPFTNDLLQLRKLDKIKGTYLAQFKREVNEDDRIHPVFNLHIPRTYRSSCNEPNFQNIPIRDELAKKVTRGGIIPSPGNRLLEADFGSLEVRISACYHKDPNMLMYINDLSTDMHRDSAADIWLLPSSKVSKEIRFYAKNGWVFPQFYGDWYDSCARGLWSNCLHLKTADGITLREHIQSEGIHNLDDFISHCKEVEDKFWNVRFKRYKMWKDTINEQYRRQGYIETYFGFRLTGYMSKKDVTNYPIQSTAFHCLLWSFIEADRIAREEQWASRLIGQIHDSVIVDLHPEETEHVISTLNYIMNTKIRQEYSWIIVPLEIDFELTEVDQAWSTKTDFDLSSLKLRTEN